MYLTDNLEVTNEGLIALKKKKKAEVIKWLKSTGEFSGIDSEIAKNKLNEAYGKIQSWKPEKGTGQSESLSDPEPDQGDNPEGQGDTEA